MNFFDKFLVQKSNEVHQSPFLEKFELDDCDEGAFPTLSNSLEAVVGKSIARGFTSSHLLSLSSGFFRFYA